LLLAALGAQFVADFIVSSARILILPGTTVSTVIRATWIYAIDAALSCIALVVAEDVHTAPIAALALVPLLGLLAVFAHERHQRLQSMLELSSAYRGTALVLGDVIEADDGYTGEHCKSVVSLAIEVAEHLGLSPERQRNLEFAALLHDVGKIGVDDRVLKKPGALTPDEFEVMKQHPSKGANIMRPVAQLKDMLPGIELHHEHVDGGGYPYGLKGDQIPLMARIISVSDVLDAMTTNRPYQSAFELADALDRIRKSAGKKFDGRVVEALDAVIRAGKLRITATLVEV